MSKRVYLVHGWGGSPERDWFPWLTKQLTNNGFEVSNIEMPNTETPIIEEWVSHLNNIVEKPDENSYFIGHSIGCQAIMRYLQTIDVKVGGVLFVAGWFNLANLEEEEIGVAEPWINTPIDFKKVKKNSDKIVVLISDNDSFNCVEENVKIFEEKLNADVKILHNYEHFNEPKYPIILKEAISLLS